MSKRIKKISLNKKESKKEDNPLEKALNRKPLYYSGFCFTDNKTFAFFYTDSKFFIDNVPTKDLNRFILNEADLDMEVDKTEMLVPSKGVKSVSFNGIGLVDRDIFNTMRKIYPNSVFHRVKTFFGQTVNSMIIVLHEEYGKPVGLFKTQTK